MLKKIVILIALTTLAACHSMARPVADAIGPISPATLLADYPEFAKQYQQYQPTPQAIAAAKKIAQQPILILLGTWCPDSQRQVSALLKTFDAAAVKPAKLTMLAVDQNKQEPSGTYKTYQLRYTPTFILFKDNKEIGRVVERPKKSVSEDLAALME